MKQNKVFIVSLYIFIVGVFIHFLWEVLQSPLYTCGSLSLNEYLPKLIGATLGDGIIMVLFYLIGYVRNRDQYWFKRMTRSDVYVLVPIAILIAITIEIMNTQVLVRWGYSEFMPLLPILNIGVVPIIQLVILPFVVFWVVRKMIMAKRFNN